MSTTTTFLRNDRPKPCALRTAPLHYTNRPTPCTHTCTRTNGYACAWYIPRPRAAHLRVRHATSSGCARARPLIASAPSAVPQERAPACWSDSRSASVRLASLRPTSMYTSPRCSCGGSSASEWFGSGAGTASVLVRLARTKRPADVRAKISDVLGYLRHELTTPRYDTMRYARLDRIFQFHHRCSSCGIYGRAADPRG